MLVFITHPKYFDKKAIYRKKADLIFIFNSGKLFYELKDKYKCVNIGIDGNIKNENFFPQANKRKKFNKVALLRIKMGIYGAFKKKLHILRNRHYMMMKSYKDTEYKLVMSYAKKEKDFNKANSVIELETLKCIVEMIRLEHGDKFLENHKEHARVLLNYSNSFYRSYVYSMEFERGMEIFADLIKYSFFSNVMLYYLFNRYDLYENGFHYNYLKVISRLFIENIHRNDVKNFIKNNINAYKEEGWL
ncbi:hypothetical protein [Nautilia sp.]